VSYGWQAKAKAVRRSPGEGGHAARSELRLAGPDCNSLNSEYDPRTQELPLATRSVRNHSPLDAAPALQCSAPMSRPRIVYVLRSINDPKRYYTGITSDVDTRLGFHNAGLSSHTADAIPWELVVWISFANADRAIEFEKYLKSGSGRAFAVRHFR